MYLFGILNIKICLKMPFCPYFSTCFSRGLDTALANVVWFGHKVDRRIDDLDGFSQSMIWFNAFPSKKHVGLMLIP